MRYLLTTLLLALWLGSTSASILTYTFDNPEDEARFKQLSEELRCLVCQNQNLADSNADLARDLRRQVYEMIQQGKSNKEITDYMVARYGDFVLYRPPVKSSTALLWVGPFIFLVLGLVVLIVMIRRKAASAPAESALSEEEAERLDAMLEQPEEKRQ
jgi:cytochrome c-type biogenesis protein CcmH